MFRSVPLIMFVMSAAPGPGLGILFTGTFDPGLGDEVSLPIDRSHQCASNGVVCGLFPGFRYRKLPRTHGLCKNG